MEGHQSLKTHCSAAAGFLPKSGGGVGRRRSSFSSSSCWTPPRFLRHPKRTGGSWISVVEIRTPPLRSLPALSLQQQQQQQQEFVNIVEGNDDDDDASSSSSEKSKKKKNIDDDDEMVGSSGGRGGGRRRSSSSVHVKFVLHKECSFGEKFLLVGDDPMFGLWDLQNAIPLNWSEGHFWTAEMDLPLEKSTIQFKFILGDDASSSSSGGEFHWQPGPDRVLHIWDTPNTIVVTEDWDKAENQKLTEEEEEDQPPPLLMQQQLMMITNQDGGDNVQQLLAACGLTSINPPPPPPPVSAEAEAEAEPPIADFPNDDDDENESKPLDNIMFTSEKANELECYSSQSTQQLNV